MNGEIIKSIESAQKVLVGIGEAFDNREEAVRAYNVLAELLADKDYFVISVCMDGAIKNSSILPDRICSPGAENMELFDEYNQWLTRTLNRELCILELGVGLASPHIIRWPFEKIAFYNNKAKMYRVHKSLYQATEEIKDKCISIEGDPVALLLE